MLPPGITIQKVDDVVESWIWFWSYELWGELPPEILTENVNRNCPTVRGRTTYIQFGNLWILTEEETKRCGYGYKLLRLLADKINNQVSRLSRATINSRFKEMEICICVKSRSCEGREALNDWGYDGWWGAHLVMTINRNRIIYLGVSGPKLSSEAALTSNISPLSNQPHTLHRLSKSCTSDVNRAYNASQTWDQDSSESYLSW